MNETFFTLDINCSICGIKIGEMTFSHKYKDPKTTTVESEGFVDNRCTQCEVDHGSFKEMMEEYVLKGKGTPQEAEDFVKENRKRKEFDKAIIKL